MKDLDIAEVARISGVPASALRFYEEKGLIRSIGRRGLKRLFDPSVLERLGLIALGQVAGFSLDELFSMFGAGQRPTISRPLLAAKADVLDKNIKELVAMRNGLRHAAKCPASNHFDCPKFRQLVRAAGAGALAPTYRNNLRRR